MMFACALLSLTALAGPNFQFNYEIDFVKISPEADAVYHRLVQRVESDPDAASWRSVIQTDDGTVTWTISKTELEIERVMTDGSRQTQTFPVGKDGNLDKGAFRTAFGPGYEAYAELAKSDKAPRIEVTKESKTVAGVLCRKSIMRDELQGQPSEYVTWNCVDPRYKDWTLPSLETYLYLIDGTTRKLVEADTATSVTFGKSKPWSPPG